MARTFAEALGLRHFEWLHASMIFRALVRYMDAKKAHEIVRLCTYGNRLPQGAPTSPALANIVASRLDARLAGLAKRFGALYTRYADDLTFSCSESPRKLYVLYSLARKIIEEEGFRINKKKVRFSRPGQRRMVTGLVIGEDARVRVPRKLRRTLRARLHRFAQGASDNPQSLMGVAAWIAAAEPLRGRALIQQIQAITATKP